NPAERAAVGAQSAAMQELDSILKMDCDGRCMARSELARIAHSSRNLPVDVLQQHIVPCRSFSSCVRAEKPDPLILLSRRCSVRPAPSKSGRM
ncbi:unnamed protein product, partial [Mycena citricolor]